MSAAGIAHDHINDDRLSRAVKESSPDSLCLDEEAACAYVLLQQEFDRQMYQAESARWRAELEQAMDILRNCQIDTGIPSPGGDYPSDVRLVAIDQWREALLKARVIDPDGTNPRQDFRRVCQALQNLGAVRIWDEYVWPVE
jgi:hypothetical protein